MRPGSRFVWIVSRRWLSCRLKALGSRQSRVGMRQNGRSSFSSPAGEKSTGGGGTVPVLLVTDC